MSPLKVNRFSKDRTLYTPVHALLRLLPVENRLWYGN